MSALPVIDVAPLSAPDVEAAAIAAVAASIDAACRDRGFFLIVGHGVPEQHITRTDALARAFFALDPEVKARIAMDHGGRAWRGWFPPGGELTSGRPDGKEGLYFGRPLPAGDPRPLHGPNLHPAEPAGLGEAVEALMVDLERVGQLVLAAMAVGLGLPRTWFAEQLTSDPVVLFRIFHYPAVPGAAWGVGEHTDYGLLTVLWQDGSGGLEVRDRAGDWVEVPPVPGALICNIGDMLDRMTGGRYRSTPHRVRATTAAVGRISMPFFLDPGWDVRVEPLPMGDDAPPDDAQSRWDGRSVHTWGATYGEYLLDKVARVFPALADDVIADAPR